MYTHAHNGYTEHMRLTTDSLTNTDSSRLVKTTYNEHDHAHVIHTNLIQRSCCLHIVLYKIGDTSQTAATDIMIIGG